MAYARTFAAVVKWRGGAEWQRIFDFGFDTTKTVMLTASSSDNVLRCDLNPGGNLQTVQWTRPLPTNAWTQVAVTFNGSAGILYVNGAAVATNASMNLLPLAVAPRKPIIWAEANLRTTLISTANMQVFVPTRARFRQRKLWRRFQKLRCLRRGATYTPGSAITFAGEATDFMAVPLGADALSWQINYVQNETTNVVFGPVSGIPNGNFAVPGDATGSGCYVIVLTATDGANRKASASVTLNPAHGDSGWASYFPMRGDAKDANGNFNGILHGGATFTNDATRGTVLSLSGNGQYVNFPAGISRMQTFMAWVKWNGGAEWQRIYDFGNDTNRYSVLTPAASTGKLRFNISIDSMAGEQIADAPKSFPAGVWTHVAVVANDASVVMYLNGSPVATNMNPGIVPSDLGATNNFLGKSQWPADPYFSGELSDVRIFSRALASNEITAPQINIAAPAQNAVYHPGDVIGFSGGANDYYDAAIAVSNLTWTVVFTNNGASSIVLGPSSGVGSGSFQIPSSGPESTNGSYQVVAAATDASGRTATNSVSIYPAVNLAEENWGSFYPFATGAEDSSNLNNGTIVGRRVDSQRPEPRRCS